MTGRGRVRYCPARPLLFAGQCRARGQCRHDSTAGARGDRRGRTARKAEPETPETFTTPPGRFFAGVPSYPAFAGYGELAYNQRQKRKGNGSYDTKRDIFERAYESSGSIARRLQEDRKRDNERNEQETVEREATVQDNGRDESAVPKNESGKGGEEKSGTVDLGLELATAFLATPV